MGANANRRTKGCQFDPWREGPPGLSFRNGRAEPAAQRVILEVCEMRRTLPWSRMVVAAAVVLAGLALLVAGAFVKLEALAIGR